MFSELFNLKDVLSVPVIMLATAASSAIIIVVLKGIIKGIVALAKSVIGRPKKS